MTPPDVPEWPEVVWLTPPDGIGSCAVKAVWTIFRGKPQALAIAEDTPRHREMAMIALRMYIEHQQEQGG